MNEPLQRAETTQLADDRAAPNSSSATPEKVRRSRAARTAGPTVVAKSQEAQRVAANILEVLAGARTPAQAATALGVSLPRYYQLEHRALRGLVAACERRAQGPPADPSRQLARLERELVRVQQECLRYQSLARISQRSLGLTPPPAHESASAKSSGTKPVGKTTPTTRSTADKVAPEEKRAARKRRRKPAVRALRAARNLRVADAEKSDSDLSSGATDVQQREVSQGSAPPSGAPEDQAVTAAAVTTAAGTCVTLSVSAADDVVTDDVS